MRRIIVIVALLEIAAAACTGRAPQTAAATPTPATATPVVTPLATLAPPALVPSEPPAASSPTSPSPQATPIPNLLSLERGTFVRSWTPGVTTSAAQSLAMGRVYTIAGPVTVTPELVFELPAVANIREIAATANLTSGTTAQLQIAAATEPQAFKDIGTIALSAANGGTMSGSLDGAVAARWLRVRVMRTGSGAITLVSLTALGDLTVPDASFAGRWALAQDPNGSDAVFAKTEGNIPEGTAPTGSFALAAVEREDTLTIAACTQGLVDVWRAPVAGAQAQVNGESTLWVVGGGSLLVGYVSSSYVIARRIAQAPECDPPPAGRGSAVTVLSRYPLNVTKYPALVPGYRYTTVMLPLMRSNDLTTTRVAVLAASCATGEDTEAWQQRALLDFVANGHVLLIRDADTCSQSSYDFIPYPFKTAASGARAARGSVLYVADSSLLATSDSSDRTHFVDTAAYLKNYLQQLGDADVMQTEDPHWCGLMFAKNAAGSSGWVRAYARYGKGLIVYDGFDVDDIAANIPQAVRLARLAYDVPPGADLPCNAQVASRLVLLSSVHRNVGYGSNRDERFTFTLDREGSGSPEAVKVAIAGESSSGWRATVKPQNVTLETTARIDVVVHIPASATPTRHLYVLTATGDQNQSARASIELDVNEALAKQLEGGGRARIYGIHFDVNSARIQTRSESTIAQIALVLRSHLAWRMRVEGHTDSDGGVASNLALSRRRASAVVHDLVARYGIAARRLRSAGYGLSRPVASNSTEAGKALNRRVELVRF